MRIQMTANLRLMGGEIKTDEAKMKKPFLHTVNINKLDVHQLNPDAIGIQNSVFYCVSRNSVFFQCGGLKSLIKFSEKVSSGWRFNRLFSRDFVEF